MADLRISVRAGDDLEAIRIEGERDFGMTATLRHFRRFEEAFVLLEGFPFAGQPRPEYGEGIRCIACRPHRILYRVGDGGVLIVRVVHARQRPDAALTDDR